MKNKFFKIFISVFLVCSLLFSLSSSAFAAGTAPAAIGDFGGAIASIIAESMGIHFDYSNFTAEALQDFFEFVQEVSEKVWLVKTTAGIATVAIGQTASQFIADKVKSIIQRDNIQSNSQATIFSDSSYFFDGYQFYLFDSTTRTQAIGPSVELPLLKNMTVGQQVVVPSFDIGYADLVITKVDNSHFQYQWFYNGNLVSQDTGTSFVQVQHLQLVLQVFHSPFVRLGIINDNSATVGRGSSAIGQASYLDQSVSYTSGSIDTTVADDLPSTGGLLLSFPISTADSIQSIMEDFQGLVLENSESISYEYSDDVGKPLPYDQTIADTPWSDLAGTLDQIKAYVNSVSVSISGTVSDALTGIQEDVESLVATIESADTGFVLSFIDGFLGSFRTAFDGVSSHLGIWHYVVSWIGSISSCFSWSLGVLSFGGSVFLAPIYAVFAGTVVVAVYRRFGK